MARRHTHIRTRTQTLTYTTQHDTITHTHQPFPIMSCHRVRRAAVRVCADVVRYFPTRWRSIQLGRRHRGVGCHVPTRAHAERGRFLPHQFSRAQVVGATRPPPPPVPSHSTMRATSRSPTRPVTASFFATSSRASRRRTVEGCPDRRGSRLTKQATSRLRTNCTTGSPCLAPPARPAPW